MDLLEQFSRHILKSYGSDTGAVTVKFEAIGHPVEAGDLTEHAFSRLANVYPVTDSLVFVEAPQPLDSLYEMLLESAEQGPGASADSFAKMKAAALSNLHNTEMAPPSPVPITYHLASAIPQDWYTNDNRWLVYAPKPDEAATPVCGFEIRTAPRAAPLLAPKLVGPLPMEAAAAPAMAGGIEAAELVSRIAAVRQLSSDAALGTTPDPTLSLKYAVVRIERQWLDQSLFTLFRDWHIRGMSAGQVSAPPVGLGLIPVAAIAVRDLSVTADWSAADAAQLASAASVGPFALAGGTWSPSEGAVRNPRTQIVGWVCSPVPSLPPQSDPALARKAVSFVRLEHDGLYVAKFTVGWQERDETGSYVDKSYASGEVTMGYAHQVDMAADAINLHIEAWAATGLVWDPWGQIMSLSPSTPTNKRYRVSGTTLDCHCDILPV